MAKQLMIYETAEPISTQKHRTLSVQPPSTYEFTKDLNIVPLMGVEFIKAAYEFPIVFAGDPTAPMPFAVLGIGENSNEYLNADLTFSSVYIPAFIRRYPFVFSSFDGGENFALCVDTTYSGCNQSNFGNRLFTDDGEHTPYLQNVLTFLKDYQEQYTKTQLFCKLLVDLQLLEPVIANLKPTNGTPVSLSGFLASNRKKLKALSESSISDLLKTDSLELLYLHMFSLANFDKFLTPQS